MNSFSEYYHLICEGGAGGAMPHPFHFSDINSGHKLISLFEKCVTHIQQHSSATKIDGVNVSVRLVNTENGPRWAMDRGSMKFDDLEGITIDKLEVKWPKQIEVHPETQQITEKTHGLVKAGQILLAILDEALPYIQTELRQMKLLKPEDGRTARYLNAEFVQASGTNVIKYGRNMIAFHGVNKYKLANTGKSRKGSEVADSTGMPAYNVKAFESFVNKVHAISKNKDFDTHGVIPVRFTGNPDFSGALSTDITIIHEPDSSTTKTLGRWLAEASNPAGSIIGPSKYAKDAVVNLKDGRKLEVMRKELYQYVINEDGRSQGPLSEMFADDQSAKIGIDAAMMWHGTRLMGREILNNLETHDNANIPVGEGVVIRGMRPTPRSKKFYLPFKIAGDFILQGLQSPFQQPA